MASSDQTPVEHPTIEDEAIERGLRDVRRLVTKCLSQTALRLLISDFDGMVGTGKMLRSRLALRLGAASDVPHGTIAHAAAAVEMVHAASLLHDDVIDGGYLRRNTPAFWVERGIPGAILVGDLLLFKALDMLCGVEDGYLAPVLIRLTGEVCDAESEQELVLRGAPSDWDNCVNIARRKTGALFAFAARAAAGRDEQLSRALESAGYAVGTAYQLADDILDARGNQEEADKSLGSDQQRKKTTAATSMPHTDQDPAAYVRELCDKAGGTLKNWPEVHAAWQRYMQEDMTPTLNRHLGLLTS